MLALPMLYQLLYRVQRIEAFRRRAQNWSEDLRLTMRGRPGPADLRNRNKDLRNTLRRKSGPADLRYSKLNRNKDLRDLTRPRRRASSVPPDLRTPREALSTEKAIDYLERTIIKRERFLDTGPDERRQLISRLKNFMAGTPQTQVTPTRRVKSSPRKTSL